MIYVLKIYFGTSFKHEIIDLMSLLILPGFENSYFNEFLMIFKMFFDSFFEKYVFQLLPTLLYAEKYTDFHGDDMFL